MKIISVEFSSWETGKAQIELGEGQYLFLKFSQQDRDEFMAFCANKLEAQLPALGTSIAKGTLIPALETSYTEVTPDEEVPF